MCFTWAAYPNPLAKGSSILSWNSRSSTRTPRLAWAALNFLSQWLMYRFELACEAENWSMSSMTRTSNPWLRSTRATSDPASPAPTTLIGLFNMFFSPRHVFQELPGRSAHVGPGGGPLRDVIDVVVQGVVS